MSDPFFQLWFAVRYVHVASVALLVGGALIVAASCFVALAQSDMAPLRAAATYEWVFWMLVGVAAVTLCRALQRRQHARRRVAAHWRNVLRCA